VAVAKQLTPSDVVEILKKGTFDELVGALEDEHLECKAAPYQLLREYQCYELAKDTR
jgi:TRAP-type mannitol/chloroaromatic compound transport system substrate-binding protein